MARDVNEVMCAALSTLPWPATQQVSAGKEDIYLRWSTVLGSYPLYASNAPRRVSYLMTVDIFSKLPIGDELAQVQAALVAAGIKPTSWGPQYYETDTRYHHLPITCRWEDFVNDKGEENHEKG